MCWAVQATARELFAAVELKTTNTFSATVVRTGKVFGVLLGWSLGADGLEKRLVKNSALLV